LRPRVRVPLVLVVALITDGGRSRAYDRLVRADGGPEPLQIPQARHFSRPQDHRRHGSHPRRLPLPCMLAGHRFGCHTRRGRWAPSRYRPEFLVGAREGGLSVDDIMCHVVLVSCISQGRWNAIDFFSMSERVANGAPHPCEWLRASQIPASSRPWRMLTQRRSDDRDRAGENPVDSSAWSALDVESRETPRRKGRRGGHGKVRDRLRTGPAWTQPTAGWARTSWLKEHRRTTAVYETPDRRGVRRSVVPK
jgi:hypothetical protein